MSGSFAPTGIDILCDAAHSERTMSTSTKDDARPPTAQHHHHHHGSHSNSQHVKKSDSISSIASTATQIEAIKAAAATSGGPVVPAKRKPSPSGSSHVCPICQRVYERADHLSRHLRSHVNARQYECTRCPKRFNRADLLSRHEATHDRESNSRGRSSHRRGDRATEACHNCAASKAKCNDVKPCFRCISKDIVCESTPRRAEPRRSWENGSATPMSDVSPARSVVSGEYPQGQNYVSEQSSRYSGAVSDSHRLDRFAEDQSNRSLPLRHPEDPEDPLDKLLFEPQRVPFRDQPLKWPTRLDRLTLPKWNSHGRSSPSNRSYTASNGHTNGTGSSSASTNGPYKPNGISILLGPDTTFQPPMVRANEPAKIHYLVLTSCERDAVYALFLERQQGRAKGFPSLETLNELLREGAHSTASGVRNLLHMPSLHASTTSTELVAALIANSANSYVDPEVHKFGHMLAKAVAAEILHKLSSSGPSSIDLEAAQAAVLCVEICFWSGSQREMEQAETITNLLIHKLRRAGKLSFSTDPLDAFPLPTDLPPVVETKWQHSVRRELYKRLVLRLYALDVQASIIATNAPSIPFRDLTFSLPTSRELWEADSAQSWRKTALASPLRPRRLPRVSDIMEGLGLASRREIDPHDEDLSTWAMLNGWYGLVISYRETLRSHYPGARGLANSWDSNHAPASIQSQYTDLYRDLSSFSRYMNGPEGGIELLLQVELLQMLLHVPSDELQDAAGRSGAEPIDRAMKQIQVEWRDSKVARAALRHAGQVLRYAKELPPCRLTDFRAITVYFAGLTMWLYTLLMGPIQVGGLRTNGSSPAEHSGIVYVDGDDEFGIKGFIEKDGTPAVRWESSAGSELHHGQVHILDVVRGVLRNSFSREGGLVPPLVESLDTFLMQVKLEHHARHSSRHDGQYDGRRNSSH